MLLIGGCSDDGDSPTRVLATGQQDLPPEIRAVVDGPDVPTTLRIVDSTADVLPIKTTADGSLIPPEDVSEIGWWADSAFPGSGAGTVVITGHINDVYQGDGFGKKFSTLEIGSVVTVAGAGGQTWNYRIEAGRSLRQGRRAAGRAIEQPRRTRNPRADHLRRRVRRSAVRIRGQRRRVGNSGARIAENQTSERLINWVPRSWPSTHVSKVRRRRLCCG